MTKSSQEAFTIDDLAKSDALDAIASDSDEVIEDKLLDEDTARNVGAVAVIGGVGREDLSWLDDGICAQTYPDGFFPDVGGTARDAKKVCQNCTVSDKCLDYALTHNERYGVWGGLSERERNRLKKQRAAKNIDSTPDKPEDSDASKNTEVATNKIDRRAELVALAASTDPTTPEFIAVIEEFFGWTKNGILTSEQRLDCFFRFEAGQDLNEIGRSYGLTKAQIVSSVTWTRRNCTPELRSILIGDTEDSNAVA